MKTYWYFRSEAKAMNKDKTNQLILANRIMSTVTKRSWLVLSRKFYVGSYTLLGSYIWRHFRSQKYYKVFLLTMCIFNFVLNLLVSSWVTRRSWPLYIITSQGVITTKPKYELLYKLICRPNKQDSCLLTAFMEGLNVILLV